MHVSEKIRLLRKEKGMSQAEIGSQIGGDARQISLYETRKVFPSSEAIVKLAKVFNVSIDYLLLEDADRRPLQIKNEELTEELQKLKELGKEDRDSILRIIEGLHTKTKVTELTAQK